MAGDKPKAIKPFCLETPFQDERIRDGQEVIPNWGYSLDMVLSSVSSVNFV